MTHALTASLGRHAVDKTDITPEEGALIMQLYAELGPRWAEISKQLPGRP